MAVALDLNGSLIPHSLHLHRAGLFLGLSGGCGWGEARVVLFMQRRPSEHNQPHAVPQLGLELVAWIDDRIFFRQHGVVLVPEEHLATRSFRNSGL